MALAADEGMEMECLLTFTTDNGVAQSADGSLMISLPQLPSGQNNLEEEEDEAAEFFDRARDDDGQDDDDDDDVAYQSDPEFEDTVQGLGNNYDINTVVILSLLAQRLGVDFETVARAVVFRDGAYEYDYDDGGAGLLGACACVVPASDVSVAGLEKQPFHATAEGCGAGAVTGCAICLEDFEDGEEVTVMPCSRGHEFHPWCVTEWLGKSNTCPLCRHALSTDVDR